MRLTRVWHERAAPVVARALRPLGIVSALGWILAAAGLLAVVLGLAFDWVELLALAVLVGLVLIAAIPFVLGRTQYAASVELATPRVVVGEPAIGRVIVRNNARRSAPPSLIELPVGRAREEFRMPRLAPDAEHDELFNIPTQRRAVLTLGPVTSVRTDPIGVLRRQVRWTEPTELYVHPRTVPLPSEMTGLLRDLEGLPTRDLADDDVSFHALREYSPGDDLRHVHWRSTARTGTLMIRQFEQTRRSHLVVAVSTRLDEYADEDEFELAVSIAGSIGIAALREGKAVSVLTSDAPLSSQSPTRLLDALAGVEATPQAGGIDAAGRAVVSAAPSASVVTLVTGSGSTPAGIRAASLRLPVTAKALCLRAARGEGLSRRALGDLAMVSLPDLASLRVAMRAVTA